MSYITLVQQLKGGKGSGNFHHAGIPGKIGGSAPASYGVLTQSAMMEHFQGWSANVTDDERRALNLWQGGYGKYKQINQYLRSSDEDKQWAKRSAFDWEDVSGKIDTAIRKGSLPENGELWRACDIAALHPKNVQIGTRFKDKGFTATTVDEAYADKFKTYLGSKSYKMKIKAKKGTQGAFMDSFKDLKEKEFLLPHGTTFEVTGIDKKNKIVELEIVDE